MQTKVRSDDAWHHHALVHDGSQMSYYLDGKLMAQRDIKLDTVEGPFMVGARGDKGYFMFGLIDDLIAFAHPLSQSEIQALYHIGLSHRPLVK